MQRVSTHTHTSTYLESAHKDKDSNAGSCIRGCQQERRSCQSATYRGANLGLVRYTTVSVLA